MGVALDHLDLAHVWSRRNNDEVDRLLGIITAGEFNLVIGVMDSEEYAIGKAVLLLTSSGVLGWAPIDCFQRL